MNALLLSLAALALVIGLVCQIVGNPFAGRDADRATLARLSRKDH